MLTVMQAYFESVVQGVEAKLRAGAGDDVARRQLTLEIARLGLRLFSGKDRVAWCGVLAPFDLLNAMGVTSCFVEFVGATLAAGGAVGSPLQEAGQAGYSTDGCGYHRAVTGATLQGIMPDPDFLIATSAPCTGGLAVIENLARHFRKDLFVIHVPQDRGEAGVAYLADQFRAMTRFVAAHTGEPLDPARLRAVIESVNRVRKILLEMYTYARTVPSPARRRDMINFGILVPLLFGTDAAVRVAEAYRNEFKRKADAGVAGIQGEQVRLLWIQNRIQFRNPVDEWLAEQYRAAIVIDELNDIDWEPIDPDDPYVGLARRALSIPLTSTPCPPLPRRRGCQPVPLGLPAGHRDTRPARDGAQGCRCAGLEPGGGLRRRAQLRRRAGPHPHRSVHGDAAQPACGRRRDRAARVIADVLPRSGCWQPVVRRRARR
jgi:hypothetical protein